MNPMLSLSADELGLVGVQFDRWDGQQAQYTWTIEIGGRVYTKSDLRMGASDRLNDAKALATLLDFLSAYAEAIEYERRSDTGSSENGDLFPEELRDWAEQIGSDGFYMLASALREEDD